VIFFTTLSAFVFIIVSSVTLLYPRSSPFFYTVANKLILKFKNLFLLQ
jgi:hypothetical protein